MLLLKEIEILISELNKKNANSELALGELIYNNGECLILTQSASKFEFVLTSEHTVNEVSIYISEKDDEGYLITTDSSEWNRYSFACLLQMQNELHLLDPKEGIDHKKYSREGMIKRVMAERMQKALVAPYRIEFAANIYGDHIVTNENGVKYKVFLRDFKNETGYSDSIDSAINKLGTTKHIMHVFHKLKENKNLFNRLDKTCPFIEIYLDPLNEYKITWFYPHEMSLETKLFLSKFFKDKQFIEDNELIRFADFLIESQFFGNILIRPEVKEKIELAYERKSLQSLQKNYKPDFSSIKADLFEYQKEGISFAACLKTAIIADEMGLGKTIQAIGTSLLKKELFGFARTLVVCPASLKAQWKSEIERFSDEKAIIIQGEPKDRFVQYKSTEASFLIINYETVLRDQLEINKAKFDFLILDEAQRVKNYATKTAHAIKNLQSKHVLIITGTPIENKLIDLFSIVSVLDPHFLGPLWEFSYQYCLFDTEKHNKINGYYNLQELKKRLSPILLRREKRKVLEQMPNIYQYDIPIGMTPLQQDYHASYVKGIAQITRKKFLTPYDMQKMQLLLANMRMVCDSTYLIDEETNESPKLDELKYILLEQLDLKNSSSKVIIFSEWVKMHKLIGKMLRENGIGFTELNGKVPVAKRGELIKRFETSDSCKVFLSTEAGGSGLNLQMADILVNFELPWNPAKKNQRIGRIDRLGQKSSKLTIYNLITNRSIEQRISLGLLVKQNLFDGVLNDETQTNFVDFSEKGRSQFLQQMEEMVAELENEELAQDDIDEKVVSTMVDAIAEKDREFIESENAEDNISDTENDLGQTDAKIPEPVGTESSPQSSEEKTASQAEQMEQVMNNGMQFLSGLFQMATGKSSGIENQKIEINKETGEVTMRFKLPVM
jgi:SNF2 family DNA or RNA helicase